MKLVTLLVFLYLAGNGIEMRKRPNKSKGKGKGKGKDKKRADMIRGDVLSNLRIIGGMEVHDISLYPFTAVLIEEFGHVTTFLCACSKVSRFYALTTAACVTPEMNKALDDGTLVVRGNTLKWKYYGDDDHNVISIKKHPEFNKTIYDFDAALVRVKEPFKYVSWLKLPPQEMYEKGQNATTLGWGRHNMDGLGEVLEELFVITLSIVDWQTCKAEFKGMLTEQMFCAGAKFQGPCTHDAGGPVYTTYNGRTFLIGLVSFTYDGLCGVSSYTSIFTNLWKMRSWISKYVTKDDKTESNDSDYK